MHSLTPHLICAGASDAIAFQQAAFGAMEVSCLPAPNGTLVHAMPRIGDSAQIPVDPLVHHWSVTTHIREMTLQEISQAVAQMDFGVPKCG